MEGSGRSAPNPLSSPVLPGELAVDNDGQDAASTDPALARPAMARLFSSRLADPDAQHDFLDAVAQAPWKFDFLALVRRLEALYPDVPGVGRSDSVRQDPLRFCQEPSLAFAPCTVSELKHATDKAPQRLFVNFLGMLGPNGPLPLHLTEFARDRERIHKDRTFARFLDLFNHRMIGLFYRAWAASQLPASFDRWEPPLEGQVSSAERQLQLARDTNRYSMYIGSLFGIGMDSLRHRNAVPDIAKLHFAGRLASPQRNSEGLRSILRAYFNVEVEVVEFHGRFVRVPPQYGCALGVLSSESRSTGQLGGPSGGAMCGTSFFDCAGAFRLRLGPMGADQFARFIPGSPTARRLAHWIRAYLGDELYWDAEIILRREDVSLTRLGRADSGIGSRLGWTSWILSKPSPEDRSDLLLRSAF